MQAAVLASSATRTCSCLIKSRRLATPKATTVSKNGKQPRCWQLLVPEAPAASHICLGSRSTDAALSDLKRAVQGTSIDPLYLEGAAYLKSLGITNQAEIARVLDIAMNPKSLFLTYRDYKRAFNASARPLEVEKDMKPVVEFLLSQGAQPNEITRIIIEHPPILSYSVEERLKPFWEYLSSAGVTNVLTTCIKRPSLLGLDATNNVKKMVEYLRYIETPEEQIVKYLETCL